MAELKVTDADGLFRFDKVAAGGYTLRARAPGHPDVSRAVQGPEPSGEYDMQFP